MRKSNKRSGTRLKTESETGERHFFSLASHGRLRFASKTLTARFTDFFIDFEEKTDCFAVYFCLANEGIPSGKRARSIDDGDSSENAT